MDILIDNTRQTGVGFLRLQCNLISMIKQLRVWIVCIQGGGKQGVVFYGFHSILSVFLQISVFLQM